MWKCILLDSAMHLFWDKATALEVIIKYYPDEKLTTHFFLKALTDSLDGIRILALKI
jgi:hypothetical protein